MWSRPFKITMRMVSLLAVGAALTLWTITIVKLWNAYQ